MGREWYYLRQAVTIPAGTAQGAFVPVTLTLPDIYVEAIHWRVPPGPSGLMGFQITSAGSVIIPWTGNALFIVADDEHDDVAVGDEVSASQLQVNGYNSDTFPHTVYLSVKYKTMAQYLAEHAPPDQLTLLPAAALAPVPGASPAPTPTPSPAGTPYPAGTPSPGGSPLPGTTGAPLPTPTPAPEPAPARAPYPWRSQHVTILVQDPQHVGKWWMVTTEPRLRYPVTSVADVNAYQAAQVPVAKLSEAELATYPVK